MLIGIAIVILALYHFYNKEKDVDKMLSVVMWCGYIVSIFVIIKYGYATIIMLLTGGIRISSDYINSNVIGMNASFSVFITAYYMMFHKFKIKYILVIPALLATIVSGSRKAFIILSVGIMFLLLFKMLYFKDNKSIREIGKTILLLFVTIVGLIYLNKINAFALLISRMDQILLFLNGTDKTFHSLSDRSALIDLGINAFHSSPLVGIGADCIGFVNGPYFGQDYYYSHNNFVEMLANGGIIGFCLYYYIYVYIIFSLIKYRDFHNKEYIVCVIFAALKIVLDYAYVSYDSRVTYFIIALLYIEARKIKKNKIWVW